MPASGRREFFASLLDPAMPAPAMAAADYPDFYRTLVAEKSIRPRGGVHPRLSICDPFDARLQQADVVILGSLNEGTWPKAADPGPWLSRPMRQALGLPAPEERIGAAAHDFASQLGAARVVLTRAAKVDGAPTVPSRWLLRLQALVKGMGLSLEAEQPWLAWARARNAVEGRAQPVRAPEPRPPVAARPRQLSVTAIETWIANPYAVFARHILRLEALPMLGERPGAALRGQIVHEALGRFAQRFPERLPPSIAEELTAIAEAVLADYIGNPRVAAFWAARLARFGAWFAETEGARRAGVGRSVAEASGKLVLAGPAGPFTLTARADRIDVGEAGIVITDYKTGQNLDDLAGRAVQGDAPQLPLEAAIAAAGGFAGVPAGEVALLRYISTSGGEPPGQEIALKADAAALARAAQEGLDAADRRVRPRGDALSRPAPRPLQVRLRRLCASRPRRRVVRRCRRGGLSDAAVRHRPACRTREETRRNQAAAADPAASAWVSANAGTGKTHVLTMRVLRLLLAGTDPQRILALTYTKAAAAEMATRVFARLAEWVTASDADLGARLGELLDRRAVGRRDAARAPAVRAGHRDAGRPEGADHPRLLRAAAAALPAGGRRAARLRDPRRPRARRPAGGGRRRDPGRGRGRRTRGAARPRPGVRGGVCRRGQLRRAARRGAAPARVARGGGAARPRRWRRSCRGGEDLSPGARSRPPMPASRRPTRGSPACFPRPSWPACATSWPPARTATCEASERIDAALAAGGAAGRIAALAGVPHERRRAAGKSLIPRGLPPSTPMPLRCSQRAQRQFLAHHDERCRLQLLDATLALVRLGNAVMQRYAEAKARQAKLDFDDLIGKAASLLRSSSAVEWVLYKLDGGLDHILVDEAQDTSPVQWQVIRALAEEFFSGRGAREEPRTLFAVGDEKQSIYSFQGAAPRMFAAMGEDARAARRAGRAALAARSAHAVVPLGGAAACGGRRHLCRPAAHAGARRGARCRSGMSPTAPATPG